ncbi:ATP-grasp domain-containing protein [Methylobacter sp.]|uniref:ATP-grasp domain-containing protein n=1 Tax=Methylobacter sp. TaxID=2051955 RepID=UPI002FDD5988
MGEATAKPIDADSIETVLIVAGSGRMLAQAARKAGLKPLVIDLFADLDTQSYAEDFRQVKSLAEQDLAPAVDYFIDRYAVAHVIYGSGFEGCLESLYYLNSRLIILGNHPDVFTRQFDKQAFFSVLDQLNIPYPDVVFSAPDCAENWLVKPMQGQGGIGIKRYYANAADSSVYWQKFQTGTAHSVLFLADGQQVEIIGFNTQWPVRLSETQEFVFSGLVNNADLQDKHKTEIMGWLKQMVPVFQLKGLNSLDFVHAKDCSYVLEINPRLSASMQLYDDQDLLVRHIQASVGTTLFAQRLDSGWLKAPLQTGYQVIYAEHELIIPDYFEWPGWCMDLPKPGNMCRAGQPLCSIIAHQNNLQSVVEQLLTKQQFIINKLERF